MLKIKKYNIVDSPKEYAMGTPIVKKTKRLNNNKVMSYLLTSLIIFLKFFIQYIRLNKHPIGMIPIATILGKPVAGIK